MTPLAHGRSGLHAFIRRIDRVAGWIDQATQVVLMVVLAAIFLLMITQVLLRYVIHSPVFWIEEAAAFLLPVLAVWGSAVCLRHRAHIAVDFFAALMPTFLQRMIAALIYALIFYFALNITQAGFTLVELNRNEMATSGAFSLYWPRMSVVVGGVLLMVQTAVLVLREMFVDTTAGDRDGR